MWKTARTFDELSIRTKQSQDKTDHEIGRTSPFSNPLVDGIESEVTSCNKYKDIEKQTRPTGIDMAIAYGIVGEMNHQENEQKHFVLSLCKTRYAFGKKRRQQMQEMALEVSLSTYWKNLVPTQREVSSPNLMDTSLTTSRIRKTGRQWRLYVRRW